jgi:hypothetical protein
MTDSMADAMCPSIGEWEDLPECTKGEFYVLKVPTA